MTSVEVVDAVESILRDQGVLDEIKKSLFLAVSRTVKKEKAPEVKPLAKRFEESTNGKYALTLIVDLLESLKMTNTLELFYIESGFKKSADLKEEVKRKVLGSNDQSDEPMLSHYVSAVLNSTQRPFVVANSSSHDLDAKTEFSLSTKGMKNDYKKKAKSPISPQASDSKSSFDMESSFELEEKSASSIEKSQVSPDKNRRKGTLSPLGTSPNKSKVYSPPGSSEKKGIPHLEPLPSARLSPRENAGLSASSEDLNQSYDSLSGSRSRLGKFEDSMDNSIEEKKIDTRDNFEISDSFEASEAKVEVESPHKTEPSTNSSTMQNVAKSEFEASQQELAAGSFLEDSDVVEESSNLFDDDDCVLLSSSRESPTNLNKQENSICSEKNKDSDPATDEQEPAVGTTKEEKLSSPWNSSESAYRDSLGEFGTSSITSEEKETDLSLRNHENTSENMKEMKEDYEDNSDFESVEDVDFAPEECDNLNTTHRSNQEEDEAENDRLNALENQDKTDGISSDAIETDKQLDDTEDYEDDYGDDFDDDEEGEKDLDESIAESVEEVVEDDDISFGAGSDSGGDYSDKDNSYMSSPSHSPSEKKLSSSLAETREEKVKPIEHVDEDDPFQDKSGSFDDLGPETSLASKDDLEDFSIGNQSSGSEEFLKDEDDISASVTDLSSKEQRNAGRLGESNDFSISENEISGSHNLNEFGADYTTSAAPPRRSGW